MSRIMGDVYTRVHCFNHPFQHVSVDPLGPIEVTMFARSHKTTKIYPLIVRCLDTGCVAGVIMESMESKSVINDLLRIQMRFGKISKISEDQGTNLLELNRFSYTHCDSKKWSQ